MYKGSIEIATINKSCKVRFSIIYSDDTPANKFKTAPLLSKFKFNGNTYLKIKPHPFVTIDISSYMDKLDGWNTNQSFNLNTKDLFAMIQRLKQLHLSFTEERNLFYYDNENKLKVEPNLADKHKEIYTCSNGKRIWLQPCVVQNEEDGVDYEGVFLSINSVDYFSYLTYSELEFLIYVLSSINMTELSLQMIMMAKLTEDVKVEKIEMKSIEEVPQEQEIVDVKPSFFGKKQTPTIPEI